MNFTWAVFFLKGSGQVSWCDLKLAGVPGNFKDGYSGIVFQLWSFVGVNDTLQAPNCLAGSLWGLSYLTATHSAPTGQKKKSTCSSQA